MTRTPVPVAVFSDFACPFSYVAEAALARMDGAGEARVTPFAFELHPAPAPLGTDDGAWRAPLLPIAAELGLAFADAPPAPARTAKAHEAAVFAAARGAGPAFRAAVFRARFAEGRDVGRVDVLVELGAAVGLDPTELRVVLDVDTFAARVAGERAAGVEAGVRAVPTLVAGEGDDARWWSGARPFSELRRWVMGDDESAGPAAPLPDQES